MRFTEVMARGAQVFEVIAAVVLFAGLLWSLALAAWTTWRTRAGHRGYKVLRASFGGVLLLALEILIAADLIKTVAVAATLENVAALALVVLIRTFLSFSLEIEIEGVPPWKRAVTSGLTRTAEAATRARAAD